ncbi:hypothetical protein B0H13DRAFT_2300057 [Mycena leptocephala]|nr:hypothetical protein B0H13DRAFT_2300057 [Mycena leptocephala]
MESIHAPDRSRSTSSGVMSFVSHRRSVSSDAGMPPGSDSSALGGIASDIDDGDERAYTVGETGSAKAVTSIAGIVETDAPGLVGPPARRQHATKIKKTDIKLTDIPDEIRSQFKTKFTPPLLEYVGKLQGWDDPSEEKVIQIWNETFPDHAVSTAHPRDNQLVLVITKLAQDKVDGWRNRISATGIAVWKVIFESMSKEKIAKDVEFYLEGSHRDIEEHEATGKPKYMGIFQSFVFSRVIGIHCLATVMDGELGPLGFSADDPTTCDNSLKRGLNYHRTGKLVIPPGTTGNFFKSNWADRVDLSEGVCKLIPSTSAITAVAKKLKPAQWTKIIDATRPTAMQRSDDTPDTAVIDVDAEPVNEDFHLMDDDSDA